MKTDIVKFNKEYFEHIISWPGVEFKANRERTLGLIDKETYLKLEELCFYLISTTWEYYKPQIWEKYPVFEEFRELTGLGEPCYIHADPPKPAIYFYDDFAYVVMPTVTEEEQMAVDDMSRLAVVIHKIAELAVEKYKQEMEII